MRPQNLSHIGSPNSKKKTLGCLVLNDGCSGIRANTPDRIEGPEECVPLRAPPSDALESPADPNEQRRQRAAAAVRTMHPPALPARISARITQKTSAIIAMVPIATTTTLQNLIL